MSRFIYTYAETRFTRNSLLRQWLHLLSEVFELGWEILKGNYQRAATEALDVRCSDETMLRILNKKGADLDAAQQEVLVGHIERGYYG